MKAEEAKKKYIDSNYYTGSGYPDETEKIYYAEKGFESGVEFVLQALKGEVEKDSLTPFSILWWMKMHRTAYYMTNYERFHKDGDSFELVRYEKLTLWIEKRVQQKVLNLITNLEDNG